MRAFLIYGRRKMTDNIAMFIFKVFFYLLFVGIISQTYNIDKKSAIIFTGPNGSYFGYSVGILENKEGTVILVGAPKDNSTAHPNILRPGQLYKCLYKSKRCQPVTVNEAGNIEQTINYHNKKVTFHNDMKDQWLGMTLDVEPKNHSSVMVCAPRWTDSYLEKTMKGISHMNGMCYLLDPDLVNPGKLLPALTNLKRLVNRKSYYVEFSMGAMGLSASYSKENGTLLFGAPGLNDWSGGVVIETVSGENNIKYIEPPRQEYQDSYSGYAITTGRFISKNTFSIAVGAPRAANIGKVLLYSTKSTIGPLLTVEGTQVGSYFGASLCSLSINSGLLDDLIIGAPMYSRDGPEEGQVFVFKSHGLLGFQKTIVLSGSRKPYSRFGTAVTNIGDLDKDGYEDIAVGAPFEEEGRGSVYIYNGYKLGLWSRATQRITAAEIDRGIRTFGISFSRPYDVDKNGYTDIAVGAYQSDHTVVLLSQPLVDMTQTTLDIINLQPINGCISHGHYHDNCKKYNLMKGNLVFCLSYKGQRLGISNSLVVRYKLVFDSSRNVSRLFRYNRKNILSNGNTARGKRKLFTNRRACENTTFFIQYTEETNEDVWIEFEYNIRGRKAMLQQFDGNQIKPEILNRRKARIDLQQECTDSDICKNDIMVDGFLAIPGENITVYVLGRSQKVLLTVNMQNIKTTRDVMIQVHYSKTLSFIKGFSIGNNGRRLPCDVDEFSKTNFSASCRVRIDKELDTYDNMSAIYEFYIGKDYLDNVQFEIYAYSTQRRSNNVTLDLPVVSQADISVIGIAKPNEVIIRNKNRTEKSEQKITFSYIIYNRGPSLLKNSSIFISYPEIPGVLDMNGLNIVSSPKDSIKYFCSLKAKGHITSDLVRTIDQDNAVQLLCDGEYSYCTNIICRLENIAVRSVITLNINMLLTVHGSKLQQLRHVSLGSMSSFRNTSEVKGWDQIMLFTETSEKTKIVIDIHNIDVNYEVGEMKIWLIVISASGGIAIFLIISLFMFKVGFFRRLENEDLQLLIANRKLQIADAHRYQNGSLRTHRFYHRHNVNNAAFSDEIDDDETNVLIPFSNGSITCSTDDEIASVSSEESGYLEPIKIRKQRVFLK